jgi:hypothetical protein
MTHARLKKGNGVARGHTLALTHDRSCIRGGPCMKESDGTLLEFDGQEHKTHMNIMKLILFHVAKIDSFSRFYCFVYMDLL